MPALYHIDPYRSEFDAQVLSCEPLSPGKWAVILSDTCFYPTGGGQPCDTGALSGCPVEDVSQQDEDGPIVHTVLSDHPLCGRVHGVLDWSRRYDFMQQHTGQHILSHAVYERFGGCSLGLHVGEKDGYVDVKTELSSLSDGMKALLEADCGQIIARDYPVRQFFPTQQELAQLPLRKQPPVHAHLRIVSFGPEAVACCGTHLSSTGQARLIRITGCTRSHGNLRIFFVAGQRAVRHAFLCMEQAERAAAELSCGIPELREMVLRLKQELQDSRRALADAQKGLALSRLAGVQPVSSPFGLLIAEQLDGLSMRQLQDCASALIGQRAQLVCLLSGSEKGVQTVVASCGSADAGRLLRGLASRFGGKGGGRADFAQGLLERASRGEVLERILTAATANTSDV